MGRTSMFLKGVMAMIAVALIGLDGTPIAGAQEAGRQCPARELARTFAPFLDPISYFALPGGDFESGPEGWTLAGGARIDDHANQTLLDLQEPGSHSHALVLPPGGTARTDVICVEGTAPVMRFFARPQGLLGALTVRITATDGSGERQVLTSLVPALLPWWSAPIVPSDSRGWAITSRR